jgi:hypothetical protein
MAEPQLQVLLKTKAKLATTAASGVWPPQEGKKVRQLVPEGVSIKAAPVYVKTVFSRSSRSCVVGEGECSRCIQPAAPQNEVLSEKIGGTWLFPQPSVWALNPGKAFSLQCTQSFRYNSLEQAAQALCPEYGMSAFVHIREIPHLQGVLPPAVNRYVAHKFNVSVACPVGVVLNSARGLEVGEEVCIIKESGSTFGVVKVGHPNIAWVSRTKIQIIAPMLVDYNPRHDCNVQIRWKSSLLDHYNFSL